MPKRLNTIIVVPHSQARFFKFSFSTRAFIITASVCAVAVLLSVLAISFTGGAISNRSEVARLRAQNRELAAVNEQLAETISAVQSRLDDFEEQAAKLALAAGMETPPEIMGDRVVPSDRFGSGGQYDRLPESPEVLRIQGDWIATQLTEVEKALARREEAWAATPSIAPALGLMTDGFGGRQAPTTSKVATLGIRGLTPDDFKNASPDPAALKKLQSWRSDKASAERFAKEAKLAPVAIAYTGGDS